MGRVRNEFARAISRRRERTLRRYPPGERRTSVEYGNYSVERAELIELNDVKSSRPEININ